MEQWRAPRNRLACARLVRVARALAFAALWAAGCGGANAPRQPEPLSNQLPAEEPPPPRPPAEPAVAAPLPPIALPPLGMDLVLQVGPLGEVYLGAVLVPDDELDDFLMRAHAADPLRKLVMLADPQAPYRSLVDLLERARGAGFTNLMIAPERVDFRGTAPATGWTP
jgi:hypothetical protein